MVQPHGKIVWWFLIQLSIPSPWELAFPFSGTGPREMKTYVHTYLYTHVYSSSVHNCPEM